MPSTAQELILITFQMAEAVAGNKERRKCRKWRKWHSHQNYAISWTVGHFKALFGGLNQSAWALVGAWNYLSAGCLNWSTLAVQAARPTVPASCPSSCERQSVKRSGIVNASGFVSYDFDFHLFRDFEETVLRLAWPSLGFDSCFDFGSWPTSDLLKGGCPPTVLWLWLDLFWKKN